MDLLAPDFSKCEEPMVEGEQWWTADTEEAAQSEQGNKREGKGQDQACFPNHNLTQMRSTRGVTKNKLHALGDLRTTHLALPLKGHTTCQTMRV